MAFPPDKVSRLLAQCHRRCCICHRFCGVKMETDHMDPQADGGTDDIENAIPVCFECHAEIHSYNDKHPRGRKFRPEELRAHKEQWLAICRDQPDALVNAPRSVDVGPLEALVNELEFNQRIAASPSSDDHGCIFRDDQFKRAIQSGSISVLREDVKKAILEAYFAMGRANAAIQATWQHPIGANAWATAANAATKRIRESTSAISDALAELQKFLQPEGGGN